MAEMQFDFKDNYMKFLKHETNIMVPNTFVGNQIYGFGAINGPSIEKGNRFGDCMDGFGIKWEYPATGGGAAVPDCKSAYMDDITEWRSIAKIPKASDFDWKAAYETECKILGEPDREHNVFEFGFGNGVFERLAAVMGFEDALYSIAAEPEETYAYMEAVTDFKVDALDYIIDAYHPDTITYYDDCATQKNLFMSPEAYRKVIKPHHKRFAQECLKRGIIPIFHCCGHAEDIVADIIDCGYAAWTSVQVSNDIEGLIQKYGDRLGFSGGFDSNGRPSLESATEEEVKAEVLRCYETYGKYHKGYAFFGFKIVNSNDPERVGKAMGQLVQCAVQTGFELMARGK